MTPAVAALFGLAFGSFANAAIDRIPRGERLGGRSQCDACGRTLRPRELVPVISYAILRGRCAYCQRAIGLRSPLIEALTGGTFAAAFWVFPLTDAIAVCGTFMAIVIALGALAGRKGSTG